MSIGDLLLGKPLANYEDCEQRLGPVEGIGVFGLDALSSAAYGPEAALTILLPLGAASVQYVVPISFSIIVLLVIVYTSYRQTIAAYPAGGGSYTVARENLGRRTALVAAAALIVDYILVVAVGISAGIGALVSAVPSLQPHTLGLCLGVLIIITLINLRGVRETGTLFMVPTYLFVGCLLGAIGLGLIKAVASGGHPTPVVPPHPLNASGALAGTWLILQSFSSGCTAMTGVEAVSNGVRAFREPPVQSAQRTLTAIIGILILMLAGIAWLARAYHIGASEPGVPGYESLLSQLLAAIAGKGTFYFISIASILGVLAFSANTAFADFPRLCQVVADDGYLPHAFSMRGRRLVFSYGVFVLALLSGALLLVFGGVTDRLIPLFAIGAFLAFTLSQAGMVVHWWRRQKWQAMAINGLGATATGITVLVVLAAKFVEGAWITVLLIPSLLAVMVSVRRHYLALEREIHLVTPLNLTHLQPPIVVVPLHGWTKIAEKALRFAIHLSTEVHALQVRIGDSAEDLSKSWTHLIEGPALELGLPVPKLTVVDSPYRQLFNPILDFINEIEQKFPQRYIAVLIPELVERHWYNYILHNQRAAVLKALLLLKGNQRISVVDVPWYLSRVKPIPQTSSRDIRG
ncbi:MAG TPA: APC family permease [Bryobacteraceae bacterium]|nr:APC family permease [Bryobacteraceae bacterium]